MQGEIQLQAAYLLHSRPFRDTSLLLDFLTRDFGRISAIARGVRKPNSRSRGLLQPFTPLQVSLSGRHELKTLVAVELLSDTFMLRHEGLFSALYMNELMVRLVHGHESDPDLFHAYERSLTALKSGDDVEPVLRNFEISLLDALGYGIEFEFEAFTGEKIQSGQWYFFQLETGFSKVEESSIDCSVEQGNRHYYPGREIINMGCQDYTDATTRKAAKSLLRQVLGVYLGDKPLKSRLLFSGK